MLKPEIRSMPVRSGPQRVLLLHNHDNTWTPADLIEVEEENQRVMAALRARGYEVADVKVYDSVTKAVQAAGFKARDWLVFNWCEGYADRPWDYAGVTEELEDLQFAYTGCGPWTLRVSQDKHLTRKLAAECGVPLPLGMVARRPTGLRWENYPAIVKPINQHGSYGIDEAAIVDNDRELRQRVEYVQETFDSPALIEEFIDGDEYQVTVWGNGLAEVLPAVQLAFGGQQIPREQIFTSALKFDEDALIRHRLRFLCPAMMTDIARRRIRVACLQAYRALHCRDYARLDIRLRGDQPYVIDVNPNPDINSESIVTMAAQAAGLDYEAMIAQIVDFAAERWVRGALPVRTGSTHGLVGTPWPRSRRTIELLEQRIKQDVQHHSSIDGGS